MTLIKFISFIRKTFIPKYNVNYLWVLGILSILTSRLLFNLKIIFAFETQMDVHNINKA